MLIYLFTYPVLVVKIIDAIQEGWLLAALFWIGTVEIESFCLLISYRIGSRVVKGVIVSREVVVVNRAGIRRFCAIGELIPKSFRLFQHILILHL